METTPTFIRARSRKQAMDWSLVLASQGIEVAIELLPETQDYCLAVDPQQYDRALEAIRLYRIENRRFAWRQKLEWSGLTFHWGVLLWCWVLILFFWAAEAVGETIDAIGTMYGPAVRQGEWWRFITAVTLHADAGHLAANISTGLLLLGLAMARYGSGSALLAAFLSGAAGNLLGFLMRPQPYHGLGASGMVMGALGLLAAQSFSLLRQSRHALRQILTGAMGGVLIFILLGMNPTSDVLAHLGGFLAGIVFGAILSFMSPGSPLAAKLDRGCAVSVVLLTLVVWALAFFRGGSPR